MKLAIMQPYLFPYIGYFQLINAVDKFVVYDDVSYIKQGWINRNTLLGKPTPLRITVPLIDASSNKLINETKIDHRKPWAKKMVRTIEQTYSKAPFFNDVFPIVKSVLENKDDLISDLAKKSILITSNYLELTTEIVSSSTVYKNDALSAENRVLDICKRENAKVYINPVGGRDLYKKDTFATFGIDLHFLTANSVAYQQYSQPFQSSLSIIDVMMFNSKAEINQMLDQCNI